MNFNTIIFAVLIVRATVTNSLNPCHNQENGKKVPYNKNPYNYIQCYNNDSILMICDDGEQFNIEKGECNKKHHLEAKVPINESENSDKLKKYCEHLSNGVKLPHSKNCEEYYVCYNKVAYLRRCKPSRYFSSRKATCVRREEAECDISLNDGKCENKADGTLLPHQTDCDKFYVCTNDKSVEKICRLGLHFSPKISKCTYPKDAGCDHSDFCKNKMNGETVANPRNCSKFYLCLRDEAIPKDCADGLHYSPTQKYCMVPDLAGCNKLYVGANDESVQKKFQFSFNFGTKISKCTYPGNAECEHSDFCKDKMDGDSVANSGNCSKYYICLRNEAIPKDCADGLHYSPTKKYCMVPDLAGCIQRI